MRSSLALSTDVETLWKAAKKHDVARVKELLVRANAETGSLALVNELHPRRRSTALMAACLKRETEHKHPSRSAALTVQLLLEFGADSALRGPDGDTALHWAAACNQVRSVEFLVTAGVDAFALNARGHSALDEARWHRSADVADVLTQLLRVHSGWLFVRTTKRDRERGLRVWKKRWAVALACDTHHRVVELALFKDRDDACPQRVVLLHADTEQLVAVPKAKWLDRHNMFRATTPLIVQKTRARRFSRHAQRGEPELLEFAADGAAQREAWLGILRRSAYGMPMRPGQLQAQAAMLAGSTQWQPTPQMPVVVVESQQPDVGPYNLFGDSAAPLSPLGVVAASSSPATTMTVSPAHVAAAQRVDTSPRARDAPSAPSFISSESLRMSQLALVEPQGSKSEDVPRRAECVICMDAPRDAICVPCGHVAGCYACLVRQVEARSGCPICRAYAQTVVKIFDV